MNAAAPPFPPLSSTHTHSVLPLPPHTSHTTPSHPPALVDVPSLFTVPLSLALSLFSLTI